MVKKHFSFYDWNTLKITWKYLTDSDELLDFLCFFFFAFFFLLLLSSVSWNSRLKHDSSIFFIISIMWNRTQHASALYDTHSHLSNHTYKVDSKTVPCIMPLLLVFWFCFTFRVNMVSPFESQSHPIGRLGVNRIPESVQHSLLRSKGEDILLFFFYEHSLYQGI